MKKLLDFCKMLSHTYITYTSLILLVLQGHRAGLSPTGLGPVCSQLKSFVGEVAFATPRAHARLLWAGGLLGAWPLMAVDGIPFVTQAQGVVDVWRQLHDSHWSNIRRVLSVSEKSRPQ